MTGEPRDTEGAYDLGSGHFLRPMNGDLIWSHPKCRSWHHVDVSSGEKHRVAAGSVNDLEHLTIVGSLLCPVGTGSHGFIENGRWRDA